MRFLLLVQITVFLVLSSASSGPGYQPRAVLTEELNQKGVHDLYDNGDFEKVIDVLERFQRNNPHCSFSDSVFIAKHLAVVYSASPDTREKGRYYMMRLLELVPTAKLVDMFVSDEIDRIFEKVREEFLAKQHGFGLDTLTFSVPPHPGKGTQPMPPEKQDHKAVGSTRYWIYGGAAILTIGATAATLWTIERPEKKPREIYVPKANP